MIDRETVMELASSTGFGHMLPAEPGLPQTWVGADADKLQRFAAAVAQKAAEAERETCANLAESELCSCCWSDDQIIAGEQVAAVIRARGTGGSG